MTWPFMSYTVIFFFQKMANGGLSALLRILKCAWTGLLTLLGFVASVLSSLDNVQIKLGKTKDRCRRIAIGFLSLPLVLWGALFKPLISLASASALFVASLVTQLTLFTAVTGQPVAKQTRNSVKAARTE